MLGAAGIVGIAVGFAAQTSMSNLISGLFLISEKPFSVGDAVKVDDTVGIVISIDLLSTKVRTFDNRFSRTPNATIINTVTTNITYYPIRRMDIKVRAAYKDDITKVQEILTEIARVNTYCLDEPEPVIVFTDFDAEEIEIPFPHRTIYTGSQATNR